MTEPTPKFTTVIQERRRPYLEVDAQKSEIRGRRFEAKRLSDKSMDELKAAALDIGIHRFLEESSMKFGSVQSDSTGRQHAGPGRPQQVGASVSRDIEGRVYSWSESDNEQGRKSWLNYTTYGESLDYLRRKPALGGYTYQLSRYAVMLISGEFSEGDILVWHGEVPQTHFDAITGRSARFDKHLSSALESQDAIITGTTNFRESGDVPLPPFANMAVDLSSDPKSQLEDIELGLYSFADKYYTPPEAQLRTRRVLIPALFRKKIS